MPEIYEDEAILLRPLHIEDEEAVFEAASESIAEISPWMEWCHPGYRREETREFLAHAGTAREAMEEISFAIVERATKRLLGCCGVNQFNRVHDFANLGYWVRTSATRRGVATRATRLCARHGFGELGLARIEIVVSIGNAASRRVAERVGACREGVLRSRLKVGDRRDDAVLFSLIPADFAGLVAG